MPASSLAFFGKSVLLPYSGFMNHENNSSSITGMPECSPAKCENSTKSDLNLALPIYPDLSATALPGKGRPKSQKIKAIWIDVDQTLLDFDLCAKDALQAAFEAFSLPWKEEYFAIFLKENAKLWDQIEEGKMSRDTLRQVRFPIMFKRFGLPLAQPAAFESRFSQVLHSSAHPLNKAREGLKSFRQKQIPLFVISNGPAAGQKNRLEKAGMLADFIEVFTSQDFQCAKPDLQFFCRALEKTRQVIGDPKLKPEQVLVIGDSWKADICGALDFGSRCIWLRANRQHDPFEAPKDERVVEVQDWQQIIDWWNQQN